MSGQSFLVLSHVAEWHVHIRKVLVRVFVVFKEIVFGLYAGLDARLQPVGAIDDLPPPDDYRSPESPCSDAGQEVAVSRWVEWGEHPGQGTDGIGKCLVVVHGLRTSNRWLHVLSPYVTSRFLFLDK